MPRGTRLAIFSRCRTGSFNGGLMTNDEIIASLKRIDRLTDVALKAAKGVGRAQGFAVGVAFVIVSVLVRSWFGL